MTQRIECRKCGAELDPKQKVCPRCGERTAAGGKFHVEDEVHWRPSPTAIKVAVGVFLVVLIAIILRGTIHVAPPEAVAKEWFEAMTTRSIGAARECVTPAFESSLSTRQMSLISLSDEYFAEVDQYQARYSIAKPVYRNPSHAEVSVHLTYPGTAPSSEVKIQMVKVGRRWKVDGVM